MKYYAILLLVLILLSACVQPTEQPPEEGELGIGEAEGTGLEELPEDISDEESLIGEPVDLGSII